MQIKDVCRSTGLTKKAIYYYEKKGLINPEIMDNGYREFSAKEVEKLKQVYILKSLGLSIDSIKKVLGSKLANEELRISIIKKNLEEKLIIKQNNLLQKLLLGENTDLILKEIEDLNKNKTIKERIMELFPGFYGRFLLIHFSRFLNIQIKTEEQRKAYKTIIQFLDDTEALNIPENLLEELEEAMDFWTDEKIEEFEIGKEKNIKDMENFLKNNSKAIKDYMDFKKSKDYEESTFNKLMNVMKNFNKQSGYSEIFIPAMRKLSPAYNEYYESLLEANEKFIKYYKEFK